MSASAPDRRSRVDVPPIPEDRLRHALGPLDRRGFLRAMGGVAALGWVPTGCTRVPEVLRPDPAEPLAMLSPRGYAVFTAAAMRLVGPRGADDIAAGRIAPARTADAWLARTPDLAAALGQGLWLLELAPRPLLPKLRVFTALDPAHQDRVLEDLMSSRLDFKRDLFKGLKSLALLSFYGATGSRAITGYPGPFGDGGDAMQVAMRYEVE